MIIICNFMGAVFGLLGLSVGFVVFGLTRSLTAGLVTLSGIWCWFGRTKANPETEEMSPAPSIFFIPLFYWGMLLALAIVPAIALDISMFANPEKYSASDPLRSQFNLDEAGLKTNESDNPELSADLILFISKAMPGEPVNVRIKSSKDAILVLVKLADLRKIPKEGRQVLLDAISELAQRHRPGVKVYAGIKGKIAYGAISTPGQPAQIGSTIVERPLWCFYESTQPSTEPTPEITSAPESDK
ncbi:MAG: hypothetical protein U0795_23155 [Pirellulales bacterium]